jgi:hypothetical protein
MTRSPGRRIVIAAGLSLAMLVVLAAGFPRIFLANDDIGMTEYLRKGAFTPWLSPVLAAGFRAGYQYAPSVPWWGLYQYALIWLTGAVLLHSLLELIDPRPGLGQVATRLGGLVLGASHAILVIGITWTSVSISALGTGAAAFVAHALHCQATGRPISRRRGLIYGLVAVSGYMLRLQGLGAIVAALFPLVAWTGLRFLRRRYLPRPSALAAFVGPFALIVAIQGRVPQGWNDTPGFEDWTGERGRIHGHAAYEYLDQHAPELVERAGWTVQDYRDFTNWLIIDERDYPVDKIRRLLDTGGVPEEVTPGWAYRQLHDIYVDSSASVAVFLCSVIGGVVLALLGVIERRGGLAFCLGYLVFLVGLPVWMSAHFRFPQRVTISFYTVAALGVFVFLTRAIR